MFEISLFIQQTSHLAGLTGDGGGEYVVLVMEVGVDFKVLVARFFSFSFCSASLWLKAIARFNSSSSRNSSSVFRGGTYKNINVLTYIYIKDY